MKNPPNFVMYVVMVKRREVDTFHPLWGEWVDSVQFAKGFARKGDADRECEVWRVRFGKKNVYVQQYGPYS